MVIIFILFFCVFFVFLILAAGNSSLIDIAKLFKSKDFDEVKIIGWKRETDEGAYFKSKFDDKYIVTVKYRDQFKTFESNGFGIIWESKQGKHVFDCYSNLNHAIRVRNALKNFVNEIRQIDNEKEIVETQGEEITQTERLLL